MKKLLSLSAGIMLAGALAAQALPNGSFEDWSSNIMWTDLINYQTSNSQYISKYGLSGNNVTQLGQSFAYHGNYAVQLTTSKIGADTLVAYLTNSANNPLKGNGGIPYSQKPTGIRFYYECNVQPGDTSGAIAVFKNSGHIIGVYEFPITGTQLSYTLYTNTFSPALPMAPDTVIFAAISSVHLIYDNNNSSKGCIPGTTFSIDSVTFTDVNSQPAEMNGDFENWTTDTLYDPAGWNSTYPGVFQTTDHYTGSYAVQLTTTIPPGNNGPQSAIVSTGNLQNNNAGGYPYTLTNDTLEFYYKYAPATVGDSGIVNLNFKKNGSIFFSSQMVLKPETVYTLAKLGFGTISPAPDTVIVSFSSSMNSNPPMSFLGSVLKVDNAWFKSQPLSVLNLSAQGGIKVYPNPVTSSFCLNTEGFSGSIQRVDVYDMTGKAILSENLSGSNNTITNFDISKNSVGIYIVRIVTSQGVLYKKISKIE